MRRNSSLQGHDTLCLPPAGTGGSLPSRLACARSGRAGSEVTSASPAAWHRLHACQLGPALACQGTGRQGRQEVGTQLEVKSPR